MMNYTAWKFWIEVAQALVVAGVAVYAWLLTRTRVNAERIRKLEQGIEGRLDRHEERITRTEDALKAMPEDADLRRIHKRLDMLSASLQRLEGEFHSAKGTLSLIHEFLLHGGKK